MTLVGMLHDPTLYLNSHSIVVMAGSPPNDPIRLLKDMPVISHNQSLLMHINVTMPPSGLTINQNGKSCKDISDCAKECRMLCVKDDLSYLGIKETIDYHIFDE
jgi:hypothetical protein